MGKDTNIYRITDIQKLYGCSYSEAVQARKLLWYLERNIEELEEAIILDEQERLLKLCIGFSQKDKVTKQN